MAFEDPTRHPLLVLSDLAAVGTVAATIVGWLPSIAAVLSILWLAVNLWESRTFQNWLRQRRVRRLKRLQETIDKLRATDQSGRPTS